MYNSLKEIPQFTIANYHVNVPWNHIDSFLGNAVAVNMDPEYQRGYVWSLYQKERYVEYCLRGGKSGRDIYWNCPNWSANVGTTPWHDTLELVDGKQRLSAVQAFLSNQLRVFGKTLDEYGGPRQLRSMYHDFVFHVHNLPTQQEVIEWYLGMNTGGSIHTEDDLKPAYEYLRKLHGTLPHRRSDR